jgi:hypothetical protein
LLIGELGTIDGSEPPDHKGDLAAFDLWHSHIFLNAAVPRALITPFTLIELGNTLAAPEPQPPAPVPPSSRQWLYLQIRRNGER